MKDLDFAKALFGADLLEGIETQIKNSIKQDFISQFTLFGVIGLLSAVSPELIAEIANRSFESVKGKYAKELDNAIMDEDDFTAIFAQTRAEIMATFDKIAALVVAHIAEV